MHGKIKKLLWGFIFIGRHVKIQRIEHKNFSTQNGWQRENT